MEGSENPTRQAACAGIKVNFLSLLRAVEWSYRHRKLVLKMILGQNEILVVRNGGNMQLTAVLIHAEDGGYVALNPETGTTTQGETIDEALANLQEATSLYLEEFPTRTG